MLLVDLVVLLRLVVALATEITPVEMDHVFVRLVELAVAAVVPVKPVIMSVAVAVPAVAAVAVPAEDIGILILTDMVGVMLVPVLVVQAVVRTVLTAPEITIKGTRALVDKVKARGIMAPVPAMPPAHLLTHKSM